MWFSGISDHLVAHAFSPNFVSVYFSSFHLGLFGVLPGCSILFNFADVQSIEEACTVYRTLWHIQIFRISWRSSMSSVNWFNASCRRMPLQHYVCFLSCGFISLDSISFNFMSFDVVSLHFDPILIFLRFICSCHFIALHCISFPFISCHVISVHFIAIWPLVAWQLPSGALWGIQSKTGTCLVRVGGRKWRNQICCRPLVWGCNTGSFLFGFAFLLVYIAQDCVIESLPSIIFLLSWSHEGITFASSTLYILFVCHSWKRYPCGLAPRCVFQGSGRLLGFA